MRKNIMTFANTCNKIVIYRCAFYRVVKSSGPTQLIFFFRRNLCWIENDRSTRSLSPSACRRRSGWKPQRQHRPRSDGSNSIKNDCADSSGEMAEHADDSRLQRRRPHYLIDSRQSGSPSWFRGRSSSLFENGYSEVSPRSRTCLPGL